MFPTKPALRAAMLARLRALSTNERGDRSANLVAQLTGRDDWQRARVVGLFAPLRSEPDLDQLWPLPGALRGKTVVYPRVEPGGIVLRVVNHPGELVASPAGFLREPRPGRMPSVGGGIQISARARPAPRGTRRRFGRSRNGLPPW